MTTPDINAVIYRVRHATMYRYDGVVDAAYERGTLRHRDTPTQTVLDHQVHVSPDPAVLREHRDFFGNHSTYIEVQAHHCDLQVTSTSRVHVHRQPVDIAALNQWTVREAVQRIATTTVLDPVERALYSLPSALVDVSGVVVTYAQELISPDQRIGDALVSLIAGIHSDFAYTPGATSVKTTLPDLLQLRAGVCQDYAHLAVGCLRAIGIPARYVSGHVETSPPPGAVKLQGADASHAWAGVLLPDGQWVDIDPTNNQFVDSRYLTMAWGRDYQDVSPLKGVIFSEATSSDMRVEVDVDRLDPGDANS